MWEGTYAQKLKHTVQSGEQVQQSGPSGLPVWRLSLSELPSQYAVRSQWYSLILFTVIQSVIQWMN